LGSWQGAGDLADELTHALHARLEAMGGRVRALGERAGGPPLAVTLEAALKASSVADDPAAARLSLRTSTVAASVGPGPAAGAGHIGALDHLVLQYQVR
jgi:hypothetical protein